MTTIIDIAGARSRRTPRTQPFGSQRTSPEVPSGTSVERRALEIIVREADVFTAGRRRWLLAPVDDATIDTLAALGWEGEDLEPEPDFGAEDEGEPKDEQPHDPNHPLLRGRAV